MELGHPHTSSPVEDQHQHQGDRSYTAAMGTETSGTAAASLPTDDREPAGLLSFSSKAPSAQLPGLSAPQSTKNPTSDGHDHATTLTPLPPLGRRPAV